MGARRHHVVLSTRAGLHSEFPEGVAGFLLFLALGVVLCAAGRCEAGDTVASTRAAGTQPARQATTKPAESRTIVEPLLTEQAEDNTDAGPRPQAIPVLAKDSPVNLVWQDFPSNFADYFCTQGFGPPRVPSPRPAFCKSDRPLLIHTPKGVLTSAMLFDQSKGTGVYDTLFVDFNDNGDFLDDPVYKAVPFDNIHGPDTGQVASWFPNVHVRRAGKDLSVHVQIFLEFIADYGSRGGPPFNICAIPQRWAVGTVTAGDQRLPVALVDHNWNDTATDVAGRDPSLDDDRVTRGDYMILGKPGSRELQPNQREQPYRRGCPRAFLAPYLQLDSGTYAVKTSVCERGVRLELMPANLPMGKMVTPAHEFGPLVLIGTQVSAVLSGLGPQITVPQDAYTAPMMFGGRQGGVLTPTPATRPAEAPAQAAPPTGSGVSGSR